MQEIIVLNGAYDSAIFDVDLLARSILLLVGVLALFLSCIQESVLNEIL
jgi:hypothetical protein